MEIILKGHEYKYAAEQSMLSLYPEERPVYPERPGDGDLVELELRRGKKYAVCVCRLRRNGVKSRGEARVLQSVLTDEVTENRFLQRIVKQAFYKAAIAGGHPVPVWGSLTGVRPGKLFMSLMSEGLTEREAARRFEKEFGVSPRRVRLCAESVRAALAARESLTERDVCLYIGIPFCPTRCAYCSFVSVEATGAMKMLPAYLEAQEKELAAVAESIRRAGLRVVSVYIGGGTPTTLTASQLRRLCTRTREIFDLSACREFTVEAGRPDTVTEEKLAALRDCGVTRVSVNPQTMSDAVLSAIGRHHTAADIYRAMELVRAAEAFEVNMDLIAGLPGDTPGQFEETVKKLIAMEPENITVHTLALKKGSRFLTEGTQLPSGEAVGEMLDRSERLLRSAGYVPYYLYRQKFMSGSFENVGWTKRGRENLYNICIMEELCGILSVGAGGSTKLVENGSVDRLMAPKYPREYIQRIDSVCADKDGIVRFYERLLSK